MINTKSKLKNQNLFWYFLKKKNLFPLITTCIIVPLIFWIFTFQLDASISANAYLISAPLCLIGLVYPTMFYPFTLIYILKNNPPRHNIRYKNQKIIWSYLGQIILFSIVITFIGACVEGLLMLCVSFIPQFDSHHFLTNAFRWIFSKHPVLISQQSFIGYVFWTIFMTLFSFVALVLIHTFIALLLYRFISNQTYIVFALFIIMTFNFVFSDAILIPDIFAHNKLLCHFSYICPTRFGIWSYFFSLSGNSSVYFVFDDYDSHAKAFTSITTSLPVSYFWVMIFGLIYWISISFKFRGIIWRKTK